MLILLFRPLRGGVMYCAFEIFGNRRQPRKGADNKIGLWVEMLVKGNLISLLLVYRDVAVLLLFFVRFQCLMFYFVFSFKVCIESSDCFLLARNSLLKHL